MPLPAESHFYQQVIFSNIVERSVGITRKPRIGTDCDISRFEVLYKLFLKWNYGRLLIGIAGVDTETQGDTVAVHE